MGVNAGRFKGVGARPYSQATYSGTQFYQNPAGGGILTSFVVQQPTAPVELTESTQVALQINDVPGPSSTIPLIEILNDQGANAFLLDRSGNFIGIEAIMTAGFPFGPLIGFDGAANPSCLFVYNGGTVNRFYMGAGDPAGAGPANANVNDWWYNSTTTTAGHYFWSCTGAGAPGTATWASFI